jgi:hypothetical protein
MINRIFDACVSLLLYLADRLGLSYEAINVWIFVVIWPVLTVALVLVIILQYRQLRSLRRRRP